MQFDTHFTFSDRERLQKADFESMTTAEYELAKKLAEELPLPVDPVRRRRHEAATSPRHGGRLDLRATLQRMARQPHTLKPLYTRPREELPSLVVLIDISGSMDRYSRLLLHYVHGLMRRALKVHTLTFGTRLTNITRCLKERDPDVALRLADEQVQDWKGGTRIASSLHEFNQLWARRLLGANAALLLVTDGLDRDEHGDLSRRRRAAAPPGAPGGVAEPAAALRRLRGQGLGRARAAAACGPLPAGAQPGQPGRPGQRAARAAAVPSYPAALKTPWNCKAIDSSPHPWTRPGPRSTTPTR